MTPKDMKDICKKYKPAHINITGGEPMMNSSIYNIIKAVPKSVILSMVTNGDLFFYAAGIKIREPNDSMLETLRNSGLNTIQISYGSNYNIRQNEKLAVACEKVGLNVCFSCTNIYKEREHIKDALQFCEFTGYHLLYNTPGVGLEDQFDYQTYFTYRSHPLVREDNMFWNGMNFCGAGTKKFYIAADKSIYPCDRAHSKSFNSYEEMRKEFEKKKKVYCRRFETMCNNKEESCLGMWN